MKTILTTLSEVTVEPFEWSTDPTTVLERTGLSPAEAREAVAALREQPQRAWHSCDTCWDPGPDSDPFET